MDARSTMENCKNYRLKYDDLRDGALESSEALELKAHRDQCAGCQAWQAQTESLMNMSSAMPQFDVSEALTQRIMASVEAESRRTAVESGYLIPLAVVAAAMSLTVLPLDSVDGLFSWAIGLGGLFVLKAIVSVTPTAEQMV
jgi:hypothetical protein